MPVSGMARRLYMRRGNDQTKRYWERIFAHTRPPKNDYYLIGTDQSINWTNDQSIGRTMWFVIWLTIGFVAGVLALLLFQLWYFLTPSNSDGGSSTTGPVPMQFGAQFLPFRIPYELKQLLLSPGCEDKLKKKETCISLNLFVQFLYQEFRESKAFRRWIVKRLQMEFNELLSRSAAGKLLHDIKLRNFSVGTQCPVIKDIQVSRVTLAPDKDSFQDLDLTLDIDYRGGFEASVDVIALLGREAKLAVKVTRLAGQARLQMTRSPYSHWSFSFLHEPIMEFKVDSEFRGRPLPQLVPLIINQFRRTVRKKHVLPAYKVRYRPFFTNPFLQPSVDPNDYNHIASRGVVRVTVIKCTRLNLTALAPASKQGHGEVYCFLSTSNRPSNSGRKRRDETAVGGSGQQTAAAASGGFGSEADNDNYVSIALRYVRHSSLEPFGLILGKEFIPEKVSKMSVVVDVTNASAADRAGFKKGDLVIAVNNVGITTERQAAKLMSNTLGDILVLVERKLANVDEDDVSESLPSGLAANQPNRDLKIEFSSGDEFYHVSYNNDDETKSLDHRHQQKPEKPRSPTLIPRSESDQDLAHNDEAADVMMESGGFDMDGSEFGTNDGSSMDRSDGGRFRKVQSASVLIPVPPVRKNAASSGDSGGSYSPSATSMMAASEMASADKSTKEIDDTTSNSASPSLSRKQRIAARATEKVAQVAQKWTTGKATVKDMWDRRQQQRKKQSEGELLSDALAASMTNSKSAEAELKMKVNDGASISSFLLSPEGASMSRPRSRSHSEPDTSVLSTGIDGAGGTGNVQFDKDENKSETSETSSKKTEAPQSPLQEPKKPTAPAVFQSQTKPVPIATGEPVWYQNFPVPLDEKSRYLNVMVYWRGDANAKPIDNDLPGTSATETADEGLQMKKAQSASSSKEKDSKEQQPTGPVPLGYATIYLPEVLDDCSITKSLCHQQSYALRPPSLTVKMTPAIEKLMLHQGFDARLCYGDITLGFHWLPDQEHSTLVDESSSYEEQQQQPVDPKQNGKQTSSDVDGGKKAKKTVEIVPEYILADGHKWLSTHFQQSVVCHVCQKKVWLKSAYKCVECGAVSHKKCIVRAANVVGHCGHILEATGFEFMSTSIDGSSGKGSGGNEDQKDGGGGVSFDVPPPQRKNSQHSLTELGADAVEFMESNMENERQQLSVTPQKKSAGLAITERLAGLRRRKPKAEEATAAASTSVARPSTVPTSLESLNNVDWGANDDNSPFHSLLYTKCGTYNEHMILAAKDLGKDLYTELPVEERKAKINEQIDRLQTEIDQTTEQRLELLKSKGAKSDKGQLAAELAKLDDKIQALAILMLHYCAGLQCCLDIEESAAIEEGDEDGQPPAALPMSVDVQVAEVKLPTTDDDHGTVDEMGKDGVHGPEDNGGTTSSMVSAFTTTLKSGTPDEENGNDVKKKSAEEIDEPMFTMDASDDDDEEETEKVVVE